MNKYLIGPALLALALAAGCAASPNAAPAPTPAPADARYKVGEQVTLNGQLVIKGGMPMLQAVLIQESGERWELKGIQPMDAARLQNKAVTVDGQVDRNVASPMLYRSLKVTTVLQGNP